MPAYFLVAVSTRHNLDLCIRHALAGFPRSGSGIWAYEDIAVGDFVSFLFGARVKNLYRVKEKRAYLDATELPPWEPIVFSSGREYDFGYRLLLDPVKGIDELIARREFLYVAENLLRRGGYRKTHFQADQITLHEVSAMAGHAHPPIEPIELPPGDFEPEFARGKPVRPVLRLNELILQSCLRQFLSLPQHKADFLGLFGVADSEGWEVLSEKALQSGQVDLLAKDAHPAGKQREIPIEVKLGGLTSANVSQVRSYVEEIGEVAVGAALIGSHVTRKVITDSRAAGVELFTYHLPETGEPKTFSELVSQVRLERSVATVSRAVIGF